MDRMGRRWQRMERMGRRWQRLWRTGGFWVPSQNSLVANADKGSVSGPVTIKDQPPVVGMAENGSVVTEIVENGPVSGSISIVDQPPVVKNVNRK